MWRLPHNIIQNKQTNRKHWISLASFGLRFSSFSLHVLVDLCVCVLRHEKGHTNHWKINAILTVRNSTKRETIKNETEKNNHTNPWSYLLKKLNIFLFSFVLSTQFFFQFRYLILNWISSCVVLCHTLKGVVDLSE